MIAWIIALLGGADTSQVATFASYISVRAAAALVFAFLFSVLAGNRVIEWLRRMRVGQHVRDDRGDDDISLKDMHAGKVGTPTMGGLLMLGALLFSALVFADWSQPVLQLAVAMAIGYGAIGFVDDYRKVLHRDSKGLSARRKLVAQGLLGAIFATLYVTAFSGVTTYAFVAGDSAASAVVLPFVKEWAFGLGVWYVPFAVLVLAGTSNAVNLTDGLDGLAAGVTVSATACFAVAAYFAGRADMSSYLIIPHVRGAGELTVLLGGLVGSCLGFLWFNGYPARVFMGDTGSMMIGGLLGSVALLLKQEFLLLVVGGVFVAEALSVIIQVTSYKWRRKRVFRMSPLHHHFECVGIPESHIIVRFWIVSALLALAGLSTLKMR